MLILPESLTSKDVGVPVQKQGMLRCLLFLIKMSYILNVQRDKRIASEMHKNNCFDTLRHVAALMVIFSHHHAFMKVYEHPFRDFLSWGGVCVAVFFSISGLLVTQSFQRSSNYIDFMTKRVKRIFPALIVCSFIMVYVMGSFYQPDVMSYIKSSGTLDSFFRFSALLPAGLPNVFSGYMFNGPVNGALWTLTLEFTCYIAIGFLLCINNTWKTPAIILFGLIVINVFSGSDVKNISWYGMSFSWLIVFGICFALGSLLSMTMDKWNNTKTKIFLCLLSIVLLKILKGTPEIQTIGYAAITILTICIGVSIKDFIVKGRFDVSYGLYIYAWPVQQIIANNTGLSFYYSILASMACTAVLAILSWNFVEKPFLRRKNGKTLSPVMKEAA